MLLVPNDVLKAYEVVLNKRSIPASRRADYRKWLRYFLDFCSKYQLPESKSEQVRLFIEKMHSKKQSQKQLAQAAHAVI